MANFTVRVELHNANSKDYENLHAAMERRGFIRWIINGNDVKKRLPTAEYNLANSGLSGPEVRDRAKAVADSIKPKPTPWILVTESEGRWWSGLPDWEED
jgi:hypothetical protein